MDKRFVFRFRTAATAVTVMIFAVLIIWFVTGLNNTQAATAEQRIETVRRSVINGAVLCYSIEGFYPESLDYLKDNYGLNIDGKKYLVHYRYVSADIKPSVIVTEIKQ